ncbi:polyprenyl synthetase family protein [Arthrobacter sp.]|jgi:geranylgeranyl diphosphate synthase type II|uniref:polyprenyl synthetase family protein n=1 Tax=Arthrobacter sp. TaxID=1667 RepID=UPI00259052F2|nr:polyprenyl synthetase family protein [Arthrobacter sp.]
MPVTDHSQTARRGATLYAPRDGSPDDAAGDTRTHLAWDNFQGQVKALLAQDFAAQGRRAAAYSPAFSVLWERMAGTVAGGKFMRPRLVYTSYESFGGRDWTACAELAAAFEMLHAALLVHDDVIDRDFVRRGSDNLGAVYRDAALAQGHAASDADHAGYSAAIIAGDLLLTGAVRLATRAGAGRPHADAILATIHEAVFAAAAGELDDLLFSLRSASPGLPQVLNMERLKTAVYSFEMPLRAGALLAGQPPGTADALADVGRGIGVAYQLIDDVLGTFGQPEVTGKSVESDLREGKRTILTTFAEGSDAFAAVLADFRRGGRDITEVRAVLRDLGAESYAVDLAESLVARSLGRAEELRLPASLTVELRRICDYVLTRRS